MQLFSKNKFTADTVLLIAVLAIAVVLRFWNFCNMPFMYDELSGFLRAQSADFAELIRKAKETDVHPVGIPIFIHYWSALFGKSEMVMKLPFLLMGTASIYFSYRIAEKWFTKTTAIITVAFLATLQFHIMYSQLQRPYASGMFFSVVMVWCWTNYFFGEKKMQMKNIIGFIIAASLCTYNHYFSLLFAGIVGATGLFFMNRDNALKYITACICAAALFIPHISILLYHLSNGNGGGDSWLSKPGNDWFLWFIKYLFHYSVLVYVLVGIIVAGSFYYGNTEKKVIDKLRIVSIIWGVTVPLIAFLFSNYKTPVLQFSTVSFGLPFILMFIFSFYKELSIPIKTGIVSLIILINTFTLFANRKHSIVFYKQPYEQMAKMSIETIKEHSGKDVSVALGVEKGFINYYFDKYKTEFQFLRITKPDIKGFRNYVNEQTANYFVCGNAPFEYLEIIKEFYPYILKKEDGFTYSAYCFSKQKPAEELKETIIYSKEFDINAVGNKMDSTMEYGKAFITKIKSITNSRYNVITVSAKLSVPDSSSDPTLVIDIVEDGKSLFWNGASYKSFNNNPNSANIIYFSRYLSDFDIKHHSDAEIKIYIWNRDRKAVIIENMKLEVTSGNPIIYGLYEPIE